MTFSGKTTGHLNLAISHLLRASRPLLLALPLVLSALPAPAAELRLTLANDPIAGNRRADDLYTAALAVELASEVGTLSFGERMFTDREAGTRFDETFVELGRELPTWQGWRPEIGLGALRVGEGLIGQQVQNDLHEAIGSELLALAYPDHSSWHATLALRASRPLHLARRGFAEALIEAVEMEGFRRYLRVGVVTDRALTPNLALRVGIGGRIDEAESSLLGDNLEDRGLTAELALRYRRLELRYAFNDFGTGTGHLSLAVHLGGSDLGGVAGRR